MKPADVPHARAAPRDPHTPDLSHLATRKVESMSSLVAEMLVNDADDTGKVPNAGALDPAFGVLPLRDEAPFDGSWADARARRLRVVAVVALGGLFVVAAGIAGVVLFVPG